MNKKCADIIAQTVRFGGYVTVEILQAYLPDSPQYLRRLLAELERENLLKRLPETTGGKDYVVYQVTKKACLAYAHQDSYMRRKHLPPFRARALLRSHFLFLLAGHGYEQIITTQQDKIELFARKGIGELALPQQYRAGELQCRLEETLFTAPPLASRGGICLGYTEKPGLSAHAQIRKLECLYQPLLQAAKFPISFLVICENAYRSREFTMAHERFSDSQQFKLRSAVYNQIPAFVSRDKNRETERETIIRPVLPVLKRVSGDA